MTTQSSTANPTAIKPSSFAIADLYRQGIEAGVLGAATIALWFFLVDLLSGRAFFYTPNLLGTALFSRGAALDQPDRLPISFETVLVYTWIHGLIFCAIGGVAAKLLSLAEQDINAGFGILLLFVIFEFGFVGAAMIFAGPVLQALTWTSVLIGNLLAAAVMAGYFWRHHLNLKISP
jgi:hypothetical protein